MACHFIDNVHTRTFTPKEFQVELLDGARQRNSIVCLDSHSNKSFIILKLIQELSNDVRLKWEVGKKRTVYLCESSSSVQHFAHVIKCLTDLRVGKFTTLEDKCDIQFFQVLCVTSEVCLEWIKNKELCWNDINLLVIDNCHLVITNNPLREIALGLKTFEHPPHILGVTSPLFTNSSQPACVEAQIKHLEKDLQCFAESASEIVSVLRYSSNPKELLVEFDNGLASELTEEISGRITSLKDFLDDHRYDPSEIYQDEEFLDELKDIPDPKKDPYDIINDFLHILETMGPWCADKAALLLLIHIEKLKVKTPYERHYLLLCLVSSHLLTIRVTCEQYFSHMTELECILKFSTPKVLRLIEIVRQFRPKKLPEVQRVEAPALVENGEDASTDDNCLDDNQSGRDSDDNQFDDNVESAVSMLNEVRITELTDDCDIENGDDQLVISHWKNDPVVSSKNVLDKTDVYKDAEDYIDESEDWQDCLSELITSWVEPIFNRHLGPNGDSNTLPPAEIKEITEGEKTVTKENTDWGQVSGGPSWLMPEEDEPCPYLTVEDLFPKVNPSSRKNKKREKYFQRFENYDPVVGWKSLNYKIPSDGSSQQQDATSGTTSEKPFVRWKARGKAWRHAKKEHRKNYSLDDADSLVGIVFVERRFTAKVLFHLLNDLRKADPEMESVTTQYTVEKIIDPTLDPREAEIEHKKQEQVLKRFRMRECNLLVATSVLEEGIELPRCNLVIRYDPADTYRSHAHSKATAKQITAHYISMISESSLPKYLIKYAEFMHIEKVLLSHCWNLEPSEEEELEADHYNGSLPSFIPSETSTVSVTLATAISVVNKYCAKLPSDTFTRLSPLWNVQKVNYAGQEMFVCSIRLPINSPIKQEIMGHPTWNRALARRLAALEVVRVLHSRGELDDSLEPIGKEAFNCLLAKEEDYEFRDSNTPEEEEADPETFWDPSIPRPGTTKSRQYYYKKIARCLNDCRPEAGFLCKLYCIDMTLTCPLPEEQNTRGRKLYPPEQAPQALGILTTKDIPQVCPFPIFTRSGEVEVSLRLTPNVVVPTQRQIETMAAFLNFIFTSVLRLQKYLMSFDPNATENSFFIVPTKKDNEGVSHVDWEFLELIYERRFDVLKFIPNEDRLQFQFDPSLYADAVVMPWYRNQDQPQYFYVAEICNHLNAKSAFPGSNYKTFENYYSRKYNIQIQNLSQPLLDVDHTSARLNFLTPRYVNRKGVALPTSSEETKRAKRENLEQKQILVPELCMVHVVPASLWRQAVCLPCILYRINALLLADQIRALVANQICLGLTGIAPDFMWPALDFGWNLADVLKKSREAAAANEGGTDDLQDKIINIRELPALPDSDSTKTEEKDPENKELDKENNKSDKEECDEDDEENGEEGWVGEIGMWSNDMVLENGMDFSDDILGIGKAQRWEHGASQTYYCSEGEDSDDSASSWEYGSDSSESSYDAQTFKVTYKSDYLAEAEDAENDALQEPTISQLALTDAGTALTSQQFNDPVWDWSPHSVIPQLQEEISEEVIKFEEATQKNVEKILNNNMLIKKDVEFSVNRDESKSSNQDKKDLPHTINSYGFPQDCEKPNGKIINGNSSLDSFMESAYLDDVIRDGENDEQLKFSFDEQPILEGHPGPSPALILQALTMSNANDGINLERLETIGDSFLKYAITTYLYCSHENIHEGKLSHLRSKQVSNLNLYKLGRRKVFGESMIATKFEPHDNWLPPCYLVPRDAEQALLDSDPTALTLPYNLVTQHSIPDKSIADCVEALIGAYLIDCGPRGALIFMSWLGIKVLPKKRIELETIFERPIGSTDIKSGYQVVWGVLEAPKSPLLRHIQDPEGELDRLLAGFNALERKLGYVFRDKAYLLQAMTHASYSTNRITDCYQRLEFLGDAVLDYLITRHLYEDQRAHSPGALTDLRSALVNNTIFASLAVRHGLHKYFRHLSPALGEVIQRFVTIQEENSHAINEEYFLVDEEAEDVEVPKALGDVFESIAGAIFLDSNMSLDIVWKVYYQMMKKEIELFSNKVPKSPIRELLELEPETAKFGKPEKLADGRRVRVTVEVFGKGTFKGIGRNYRIAKCTAAKCALKHLKKKSQAVNNQPTRFRFKS